MLARPTHLPLERQYRLGGAGSSPVPPLIAIVEDDPPCLHLIDELLRDEGYRTIGCTSAREGLPLLLRARPDLIILDLWLEARDEGWQILHRLRRDPRLATVPVLICTADRDSLAAREDHPGAVGYTALMKPFDNDDLLDRVSALLANGGAMRTADRGTRRGVENGE